ncbi:MAG: hypothetical protein V9E83_03610 [Baekduia sp.]
MIVEDGERIELLAAEAGVWGCPGAASLAEAGREHALAHRCAELVPTGALLSSFHETAGASTWTSMRSRSGPLRRERYCSMARLADFAGGHVALGGRVHGGDEHEAGGEADGGVRAGDGDDVVFEGLAERFEDDAGELGEFVEEEHAVVGEGDLAGARDHAAADDRGRARRCGGACGRGGR